MRITFDPGKRDRTLAERGLDFARCGEVFLGPHATKVDDRTPYGERRYITVGCLDDRMVVVVWTERHGTRRIISLREANEREQARYGGSLP
ncbi:BrnT family toxin [Methylobacterium sp. WL69]|uniref:BrnT family toxin n=1 Tax=Methylobacterium sp. WL69 TaxID=2603893 RepID=UPI0011C7C8F7|nr:BrnT family toxin [Methylobacterium sp. WL69]TXM66198.1 BrnT family toxin [Methylobacterium sp. WL69]